MVLDIVVHPEWGSLCYGRHDNQTAFRDYLLTLLGEVVNRKNPVLVASQRIGSELIELMPAERVFFSDVLRDPNSSDCYDVGQIRPEDWDGFAALLDENKDGEIRVHGCYFGECVRGLGMQTFAYFQTRERFFGDGTRERASHELDLLRLWEHEGAFAQGNVKYGVVMAPPFPERGRARVVPPIGLRRGNINYQLMDEETRVFGEY